MAARSKARKRALDILFESDARELSPNDLLEERVARADPPVNEYTAALVRGVVGHSHRIDELLSTYAQGWTLARMPGVDRNVLRLGAYEVLYVDEVPDAVAVSEATNLARDLSTDESPSFVNGVLGNIVRDKAALSA
ncbi:MAG: Transcription termination protein NusB [uncultured Nocardioidaceae bacterium]|uniref:Transcription antitermination protein NusB n=1 Tax=uncultured Nocardioidaceae bacterium TaxID=253824 RepID=A0A6J4MDX1_9ACTN|nr:MAG: Transcription termination protein NusB [uncultured Nocardioidaceae bacterium]